ncbi:MAG: aspartoacylase [Xenococcaceae cyanobacterium]
MNLNPQRINRVAITAGVHGNELTGIYLVNKFARLPLSIQRFNFETVSLLANPQACLERKRYIDRDLNRCFSSQDLQNETLISYENNRAREINQAIGPKGNPSVDFIIDLHSTTSNMGLTIIPSGDRPFNLRLAAYLSAIYPLVKVYFWPDRKRDSPFLRSICELGCTVEIGPIAQGVLNASLFQQTEQLVYHILNYLDAYNQGKALSIPPTLTLYQGVELVDYPRDRHGELLAMIHPDLHFKDYMPLHPGNPMFLTFEEQTIVYAGKSTVYPVFLSEAAYLEKGIAMCLTQKQQIEI